MSTHEDFMLVALNEATIAYNDDEIPVGAVLVKNDQIILSKHNLTRQLNDPLAHAELLILNIVKEKYLYDYSLYITLEPCLMCAGAIILKRVGNVIFGCYDPKSGVVGSIYNVFEDKKFNHHPNVVSNILNKECSELLTNFFKNKR